MANVKISALTAIADAAISATDIFPGTDADAGTPTTYKYELQQIRSALLAAAGAGWDATDYLGLGSAPTASGMIRVGQGAIVADSPLINSTATWNNAGVTFNHIFVNVTDTASSATSRLALYQVGGVTMWQVQKNGAVFQAGGLTVSTGGLVVSAGTTAVQALTATTGVFSSTLTTQGLLDVQGTSGVAIGGNAVASTVSVRVNTAAGQLRLFAYYTGGVIRWQHGANATAEAGADAGSNWALTAFTDAGVTIDSPIGIVRAAGGAMTLARPVSMTSTLAVTGTVTGSASLIAGAAAVIGFTGRSTIDSGGTDGILSMKNNAGTGFTRLAFGPATSSFAAIRVAASTSTLEFVTADNSAYVGVNALWFGDSGANRATTGPIRLSNNSTVAWRNAANSANHTLLLNGSDVFSLSSALAITGNLSTTASIASSTTITAGTGLTVSAGGITVTGNSTITGTLSGITTLTATTFVATGTVSSTGAVRLANGTWIGWRNNGNTADISLAVDVLNRFSFAGGDVVPSADATLDLGTSSLRWVEGHFSSMIAIGTTPATAGALRLANNTSVAWRNFDNSGNLSITASNTTDSLVITGHILPDSDGGRDLGTTASRFNSLSLDSHINVGSTTVYASSGALRLNNNGVIAWRNAANSANLGFALNGSNLFAFDAGITTTGTVTAGGLTSSGGATITGGALTITQAFTSAQLEVRYDASNRLEIEVNSTGEVLLLPQGAGASIIMAGEIFITGDGSWDRTNMENGDLRIQNALWIKDGVTAPTATSGFAALYVDSADGDLKVKFGDGVTKTIATDT